MRGISIVVFSRMATVDLASYKNIYIKTAEEYINSLFKSCASLSNNLLDKKALESLHISSHSLKSQSQMMGLTNMANLCAIIEKISKAALEGRNKINNDLIAVLKESVEALGLCLSQIEKENKENDLEPIIKKLEQYNTVRVI